mgnify:FL=1
MLLNIKNLWVKGNAKIILKGVNLKIQKGETVALLGPNGSGKTVLAQTIAGNPKYKIIKGGIYYHHRKIDSLPPEKRTNLGIVLAWQAPPLVKGVKLEDFLKIIQKTRILNFLKPEESQILLKELNANISGGEKKISELLQILSLKPKLVIFDEIDSGLDIKNLERIAKTIKKEIIQKKVATLFITHNGQVIKFLKPTKTLVMVDGKIICQSKDYQKILKIIKKYGYEKCKKCPFSSDRPYS